MNILLVNWTWFPSGGDWTYIENLASLYKRKGHQVIPFAMQNEQNYPTEYSKYFIKHKDYKKLKEQNPVLAGIDVLKNSIYSTEAVDALEDLLKNVKIDLAHLNIIHRYQTPAILKVLKKAEIPIVWTLHDYTILCPEGTFISNGKICEACKGGKFYQATLHKCKKDSFLASAVASLDNYVNTFLNYYEYVDYYICPSKFLYQKFSENNFFKDRLHHIYHSFEQIENSTDLSINYANKEKYIVYVGRLEPIKGVQTLLEAMRRCKHITLKIIGDGSQRNELMEFAQNHRLDNVDFLGKRSKGDVLDLIADSEFLVCPSECFEVLGFTIIEAMLMEKPVIGSNMGAIPETVIHNETGFLFEAGNVDELTERINHLFADTGLKRKIGANAKKFIRQLTDPENYYKKLQEIIPILS